MRVDPVLKDSIYWDARQNAEKWQKQARLLLCSHIRRVGDRAGGKKTKRPESVLSALEAWITSIIIDPKKGGGGGGVFYTNSLVRLENMSVKNAKEANLVKNR